MKLTAAALCMALVAVPLGSCAQQATAQNDQQPDARAQMQKARDDAKSAAFNALSSDHRARVQTIVDQINNGSSADLRAAVTQIDAVLSPAEAKAVLAERDKMMQTIRANAPAGPFAAGGPPGSPRPGGPVGPGSPGGPGARNDAGRFLLQVSVSRERMRELRRQQQPQAPSPQPQ